MPLQTLPTDETATLTPRGSTLGDDPFVVALQGAFGHSPALVDIHEGQLDRVRADWPQIDLLRWLPVCEHVAQFGLAEVIEDHAPLALLAVPMRATEQSPSRVAVVVLVTERVESLDQIASAAQLLGTDPGRLYDWARTQKVWPPEGACQLARTLCENSALRQERLHQEHRLANLSERLCGTVDELDLLHRVSQELSLDRGARDLCSEVVDWLVDVVPATCLIARWLPVAESSTHEPNTCNVLDTVLRGRLPLEVDELDAFFGHLGPEAEKRLLRLDRSVTSSPTWRYPGVREVVCVPIRSRDKLLGWIAGFNEKRHDPQGQGCLGDSAASLLASVAKLLGTHASNRTLFRQLEASLGSSVQAFSAALDAKDSYTRGHSERVAAIAVRLAQRLGFDPQQLESLRLGGLLHDVGKIGIDDSVLRKPGELTPEEYEHIQEHPQLGTQILQGIPELAHALPVVLHHHEAWDGSGYPEGLQGEATPLAARVMAVADSIDAMASHRAYRQGMPFDKIEAILRDGAGHQWDPRVVDAYFKVRGEVQQIANAQGSQTEATPVGEPAAYADASPGTT